MKTRFSGLSGSAKAWLVSKFFGENKRIVLIAKDRNSAESLREDLGVFCRDKTIFDFPAWDTLPFEQASPQIDISAARISTLFKISKAQSYVLVTSTEAVIQKVRDRDFITKNFLNLQVGSQFGVNELAEKLKSYGYVKVKLTEELGDFSVRGQVIDFFPADLVKPVRIEFSGEKILDIRGFDADSQRCEDNSAENLSQISILPVSESFFTESIEQVTERLQTRGKLLGTPPSEIERLSKDLISGEEVRGLEMLLPIYSQNLVSLFDYFNEETLIVLEDEEEVLNSLEKQGELIEERFNRFYEDNYLIPNILEAYLSVEETNANINRYPVHVLSALKTKGKAATTQIQTFSNIDLATRLKTKVGTGSAFSPLKDFIEKWRKAGNRVAFVVGGEVRAQRLQRILLDLGLEAQLKSYGVSEWLEERDPYPLVIFIGHIAAGFQIPAEKLVLISENEIFTERSYRRLKTQKTSLKKLLSTLSQLKEGDFLVHTDYGIGLYQGLVHKEISGEDGDFLHIVYADSTLYLPVQNIGKIQKFQAAEGQKPVIDKLGSTRWIRTKQKVRQEVIELAGDLIKLYATRSVAKGWRYDTAGAEDERFADSFAYNETPDQLRAIDETLVDLAKDKPMDRLVCGDVGFGKTEVAIRAAYKCLQHARQVALLVPTTILAEQHFENFKERFKDYPFKIANLSRFNKPNKNKANIVGLQSGEIDLIVGTHRLLSRDVEFKDLGLVIIDEEHRFGVKQKEKLKSLKAQVDVLTLTATPIPRTLHMSLLGIRDISVISTPPTDRRVIKTYIAHFSDNLVRDAILREQQRGGQVFYVHNRVQDIETVTARLSDLVPEARFVFAHGQMREDKLEKIMLAFQNKDADVLVTTTIIESGLDIPNANTIIIDRADALGLAQLYQLRGRVGRSTRQAYAYLLTPKTRKMSAEARERLKALQSIDDLGLGFNLAVRDLEIRGAGNLLGREQSGNVLAVGFDLYTKILREAVLNLKGEDLGIKETIDPEVKLGLHAYIPDYYIPDVAERLVMYQRLASIENRDEAQELAREMEDRFGHYTVEVDNLLGVMSYRALLRDHGVEKAEIVGTNLNLSLSVRARFNLEKILALDKAKQLKFSKNLRVSLPLDSQHKYSPEEIYGVTEGFFGKIS